MPLNSLYMAIWSHSSEVVENKSFNELVIHDHVDVIQIEANSNGVWQRLLSELQAFGLRLSYGISKNRKHRVSEIWPVFVKWLRLGLSKGPDRVSSPYPEDTKRSDFRHIISSFENMGPCIKWKTPVILKSSQVLKICVAKINWKLEFQYWNVMQATACKDTPWWLECEDLVHGN
jgi:hypothetical protein